MQGLRFRGAGVKGAGFEIWGFGFRVYSETVGLKAEEESKDMILGWLSYHIEGKVWQVRASHHASRTSAI